MAVDVSTPVFEGPFDLLLHLILKEQVDIYEINLSIIEVPFGDGRVDAYFDTSTGALQLELGALDDPDATVSTDYATAQALFVEQNQTVALQAFMSGKIKVQGDMMKMMAMQTAIPANDFSEKITQEIANITEPAPAAE